MQLRRALVSEGLIWGLLPGDGATPLFLRSGASLIAAAEFRPRRLVAFVA